MTNQQGMPEALRLADEFKLCNEYDSIPSINDIAKAEDELRRLHAENERLQQELIRESHRTAEQKLRADQMTRQHADQAAMNREARAQLAALVEAQQPAKAESLRQILTDPENQPNQYGVEFGMSGQQMHFKIGNQLFRLAYEPDDQQEFEFMKRMLIHAFSTFTPDVKMAQHPATHVQNPTEIEHVAGDVSKNGAELDTSQQPAPDYEAGWKDGYKHGAWSTQQPAPATQKLTEQICISDTNQSAACAVGNVGTTSDAQTTHSTHDAPATQQAGEVVAYLDVGANGYLDLGSELSEDALQQLPKGRRMSAASKEQTMTEPTDVAGIGCWVAAWIGGAHDVPRNDTGACEQRIETSVERLGHAVAAAIANWGTPPAVTKWAPEEIADGERGIRWVTNDGIHGRPTDHDVREYLKRTPTAHGCHCDECKQFYTTQQPTQSQTQEGYPMSNHDELEALAKRHGALSYRNRADTQNPAFGFSVAGLESLLAEVRKQDDALILQLVEALDGVHPGEHQGGVDEAIAAGRARLQSKSITSADL